MSKFLKCLISVVIAANLLITPQLCIAACGVSSSGNWSSVSWFGCSGPGGIPGPGDDVIFLTMLPPHFNVTADSDISVSSLNIAGSTLNAGAYTITLSSATIPINLDPGTFTAGTGTVLLNGDSDIKILSYCSATSLTFNNLVMGPITAPRTVALGQSSCKAVITVNGTFISGTSATNTVSFAKGDAGSNVTNPVTSYYCASNGGISNINCVAGGPTAPTGFSATAVSQTQIDLSWTCTAADETGFRIFRDGVLIDVITGPFPEADTTTAADTTSYSDTGLTAGTTYNYEIRTAVLGTDSTGVTASATTQSAAAPEINLKQSANIASGGTFDFGTVAFGSSSGAITFTIENTGSAALNLTGSPKIEITGTDPADFSADASLTSASVAALGTTTFTVTFTPSSAAAKTATLSIANNDSDENPYTVTLNGTGTTTPTPGYGSNPAPGSTITVGTAAVGSPVSTALQVSETGNATLNVTSHALGGANPGDFSVTPATLSIADGGAAQNLTVQCTPLLAGARTATLTVNHNAAGSPATYTLNCTGTAAPLPPPPPAGLPAAPSGLTAQPVSHEAIYLTWTDNSNNESGFIIERWSMGADWVTVGVAAANAASYTDSPLSYSWEYHYRIRAFNAAGNSDYSNETFAITWFHPYETCKGVTLNGSAAVHGSASVQENAPAGTVIGTFGTIEPTGGHRYEFFPAYVPGIDNGFFVIDGNVLKTGGNTKPDYEEKKELRISLLSIDSGTPYAWCHAEFVIAVTDVPEGPTFLHLSDYAGSVPENEPGAFAANIVSEDDAGDTHTYSLVSGEGDTDNALFRIEGNTLKTGIGVDYETNPKPSVRIRSTDQTGAYFERFIVLTVRNTPDPPILSDMANANTDDDVTASVKFTVSDQDTVFSYLTVSAKSDNAAVLPDANIALTGTGAERTVTLTPLKGKAGTAKITVTVTDGQLTAEKSFTVTVTTGPGLRAVSRIEGGTDGTLVAGDTLQYSTSITNDGDRDVSGVVFTVPLPEGTEYAGSGKRSDSGMTYDSESNQVEWTGDVPAGGTAEIAFGVRVTSGGSIAFSDAEIAYDSDGDGVNDAVRKAENGTVPALTARDCSSGDADADGEITLRDAVLVLQTLSGSDAEVCPYADVNDGQIGLAEALFILNGLAK